MSITGGFWGLGHVGREMSRRAGSNIEAREAMSKARGARSAVESIEARVDKLTLISMALWSLLSEKVGLTEEDLMERVKKIDLMDGRADGKLQSQVAKCPKCNRVMSKRHTKCLYCGAGRLKITAFDDVV